MKMQEDETIAQYYGRIKDVVNAIRGSKGKIKDGTMVCKIII